MAPIMTGRRTYRDPTRRRRPRMVKELLRIGSGPAMLYLVAGTDRAVKIRREDMQKIEKEAKKHIEEMYEDELKGQMMQLGIEQLPLNEDEKQIVRLAAKYVLTGYFILSDNVSA